VPLVIDQRDHDRLEVGDELSIPGIRQAVEDGSAQVEVRVGGKDGFSAALDLSPRERAVALAGGVLNQLREREEQHEGPKAEAGG
jgi:hypothetical protein